MLHATTEKNPTALLPLGSDLLASVESVADDNWVFAADGELIGTPTLRIGDLRLYFPDQARLYISGRHFSYLGDGTFELLPSISGLPAHYPIVATSNDLTIGLNSIRNVFDIETQAVIGTIANPAMAAAWDSQYRLYTIETPVQMHNATHTVIQKWAADFSLDDEFIIPGKPVDMFSHGDTLVALSSIDGTPWITAFNPDLEIIVPPQLEAPETQLTQYSATGATLEWHRIPLAQEYIIEKRIIGETEWKIAGSAGLHDTRFDVAGLATGHAWQIRVSAASGSTLSPSAPVTIDLRFPVTEGIHPDDALLIIQKVLISDDDLLYLLAPDDHSIFVWDVEAQEWASTIALRGPAADFAYSSENNAIYTVYSDGTVHSIALAAEQPVEVFFSQVDTLPFHTIATAGEYVVVVNSHSDIVSGDASSFGPTGRLIHTRSPMAPVHNSVWEPTNRTLYHFVNSRMRISTVSDEGIISYGLSNYFSSYTNTIVRVNAAENQLILDTGWRLALDTRQSLGNFGRTFDDAAWLGSSLYTVTDDTLQVWNLPNLNSQSQTALPENTDRIFVTSQGKFVTLSQTGNHDIAFNLFDASLEIIPPASLAQPWIFGASVEDDAGVVVRWVQISGASEYRVERRQAGDDPWQTIATTTIGQSSFTDYNTSPGTAYDYRVAAINGSLESDPGESFSVFNEVPTPPQHFDGTAIDHTGIHLSWQAPIPTISGYSIEMRGADASEWEPLADLPYTTTEYSVLNLSPSSTWQVRIRSVSGLGTSEWTTASVNTDPFIPVTPELSAITGLSFLSPAQIRLEWKNLNFVTSTIIERRQGSDGQWEQIAVLDYHPAFRYDDFPPTSVTTYHYRIATVNSSGQSAYSNIVVADSGNRLPAVIEEASIPFGNQPTTQLILVKANKDTQQIELLYRESDDDEWISLGTFPGHELQFQHENLTPGQTYQYQAIALNDSEPPSSHFFDGTPHALPALVADEFEDGRNPTMWHLVQSGSAIDGGDGFTTGAALWFHSADGFAETKGLDLRTGRYLRFAMRAGNAAVDGAEYWSNFTGNRQLLLTYSTDGLNWTEWKTFPIDYPNASAWQEYSFVIPAEARTPYTQFRWQTTGSGSGGHWAIDSIEVLTDTIPPVPAVSFIHATPLSTTSVGLFWLGAKVDGFPPPRSPRRNYRYSIERKAGDGQWIEVATHNGIPPLRRTDPSAPADLPLQYRIRTIAAWGQSEPSDAATLADEYDPQSAGATADGGQPPPGDPEPLPDDGIDDDGAGTVTPPPPTTHPPIAYQNEEQPAPMGGTVSVPMPADFPDSITDTAMGPDGILYILSNLLRQVFRFDVVQQSYLDPIEIAAYVSQIEYCPENNRLYILSPSNAVYRVDLDASELVAVHHVAIPNNTHNITLLWSDLLVASRQSTTASLIYAADGTQIKGPPAVSRRFENSLFDSSTGALYTNLNSSNDIRKHHYAGNGDISFDTTRYDSYSKTAIKALSNDAALLIDAQGIIYDTNSLLPTDSIATAIDEAAWTDSGTLYTLAPLAGLNKSELIRWNANFSTEQTALVHGYPLAMHVHAGRIVCVTEINGMPLITIFNLDLEHVPPTVWEEPQLSITTVANGAATLTWDRTQGATGFELERRVDGGEWQTIKVLPARTLEHRDLTLATGPIYEYRLKATGGGASSPYSATVAVDSQDMEDNRVKPWRTSFRQRMHAITSEDTVVLMSDDNLHLLMWNARTQKWRKSIPLDGPIVNFVYTPLANRVYTFYEDGRVNFIDMSVDNPLESLFTHIYEYSPVSAFEVENYLYIVTRGRVYVYDFDGERLLDIPSPSINLGSPANYTIFFSKNLGRVFYTNAGILSAFDVIPTPTTTPTVYKSTLSYLNTGSLRIMHREEKILILSSGVFVDTSTLKQVYRWPHSNSGTAIIDDRLFIAINYFITAADIDTYEPLLTFDTQNQTAGLVVSSEGNLISISLRYWRQPPLFDVLDRSFNLVEVENPEQVHGLYSTIGSLNRIKLHWINTTGLQTHRIERRVGTEGEWETIGTTNPGDLTFIDHTAIANVPYQHRVITTSSIGESIPTTINESMIAPPPAPGPLTATLISDREILLEWQPTFSTNGYQLDRRRIDLNSDWETVWTYNAEATSSNLRNLSTLAHYEFRLRSQNTVGSSEWVTTDAFTGFALPPTPKMSLRTSHSSSVTNQITWERDTFTQAVVVERLDPGSDTWQEIALVSSERHYSDANILPAAEYHYRLKAVNIVGESDFTEPQAITSNATPRPTTPTMGLPIPVASESLLVHWQILNNLSNYATHFELDYRVDGGEWIRLAELDYDERSFLHTGLLNSGIYDYRIRAIGEGGSSSFNQRQQSPYSPFVLLEDDFDPDINPRIWESVSGPIAINDGAGFRDGNALWFKQDRVNSAVTRPVDTRNGGVIAFEFRAGNQEKDGVERWQNFTDFTTVHFQYSKTGSTWYNILSMQVRYPRYWDWTTISGAIPEAARFPATRFRFYSDDLSLSNWAVDNLRIYTPTPLQVPKIRKPIALRMNPMTVMIMCDPPSLPGPTSFVVPQELFSFEVERRIADGDWQVVGTLEGNTLMTFVDHSADDQSPLEYRIRTIAPYGESEYAIVPPLSTTQLIHSWRLVNTGSPWAASSSTDTTRDNFGLTNLQRFAFGIDPGAAPRHHQPGGTEPGLPAIYLDPTSKRLAAEFIQRRQERNPGVRYQVEISSDLVNWSVLESPSASTAVNPDWKRVRFEQPQSPQFDQRCFIRIRVVPTAGQ